jgi:putative NIF3 family GTP cyclohydrolase 1 type 2
LPPAGIFPFGKEKSETCAIVSGGAAMEAAQALEEGVDLYVTGETSHSVYHIAEEGGLNMVCGGHYATEVWGLLALARKCRQDLDIEVEFIDIPTGL